MSRRVDPSLLQPRDQKWPSSDMDDSELDELVLIEIGASPIEPLKDAIPKTQVDPSTRDGSSPHESSAAEGPRNRRVSARPDQLRRTSSARMTAAERPGPLGLRGFDSRDFRALGLGRSVALLPAWRTGLCVVKCAVPEASIRGPIERSNAGVRRPFAQLVESISSGASDTMPSAFAASVGSIVMSASAWSWHTARYSASNVVSHPFAAGRSSTRCDVTRGPRVTAS